ncbi:MAG: hypothetical protein ABI600_12305 [Luteolibacter sp.]
MKPIPLVFLAAVVSLSSVRAQDEKPAVFSEATSTAARSYLPDALEVRLFTPPVPVERKRMPNIRIDATITLPSASGKTLTIQRGAASTLPDLPPPPPPEPIQPPRKLTPEEIARQLYHQRHSLFLGATVYDHKVSEVHWTDQETKTTYHAACGFDIGLIAGIQRFVHDGEQYAVDMLHSDVNTTLTRDSSRKYNYNVPKVSAGQIIITQGDPKNPYATAPLSFIKELIDSEKDRLVTYQSDRRKYWEEASAWATAHPPIPQDETVQLRPHRGSRYLANPQPEKTEGTR